MSFYCLCQELQAEPKTQIPGAPNLYCEPDGEDNFPTLSLSRRMDCIKTGARQVILDPPYRRPHYPNCDVFQCPHCGARFVRE